MVDNSRALRLAVANLLRLATAALDGARTLLESGNRRNAAVLGEQAFAHLVRALGASEHGWRLEDWNAGLAGVPEANPFRAKLVELSAFFVSRGLAPAIKSDGRQAPDRDDRRLAQALSQAGGIVDAVAKTFDVELAGTRPAGYVGAIRPDPDPRPQDLSKPDSSVPTPAAGSEAAKPGLPAVAKPRTSQAPKLELARNAKRDPSARKQAPRSDPATPSRQAVIAENFPTQPRRLPEQNPTLEPAPAHGAERPPALSQATEADPGAPGFYFRAPQPPARRAPDVSSTTFWSLMDRWKIDDLGALHLISRPGGLTKKGTRPRFRMVGQEAEFFSYFKEIDTALKTLGTEPSEWIRQPIPEGPFNGTTPEAYIVKRGLVGARDILRKIMATGLRLGPL